MEAVNGSVCLTAAEIDIFWDPIFPPPLLYKIHKEEIIMASILRKLVIADNIALKYKQINTETDIENLYNSTPAQN